MNQTIVGRIVHSDGPRAEAWSVRLLSPIPDGLSDGQEVEVAISPKLADGPPFSAQRKVGDAWQTIYTFQTINEARQSFGNADVFPDPLGCRVVDANGVVRFQ